MRSKVFISYSREDRAIADQIVEELVSKGLSPWIDRQEIQPGQSFVAGMNSGLADASYVLVLFSAASLKSEWVGREWMSALAGKIPVLPVLLADGALPALLKDLIYFDLRVDTKAGIRKIGSFFDTESRPLPAGTSRTVNESPLKTANRRQLRLVAVKCLDDAGLSSFCFDAEIEVKSLHGDSVLERVVSLLHEVANDGLTIQFANWLLMEKRRCVDNRISELRNAGEWEWN